MGFGLLFVGYATLLMFRVIPIELIGFFVIYLALDKLEAQCASFRYAKYASVYMFFEAVLSSAAWLVTFFKIPAPLFESQAFLIAEDVLYYAGLLVFHILILRAVSDISEKVGYTKGVKRSRFALGTTAVFYAAEIAALIIPSAAGYMSVPLMVFQLLWIFVNMFVIYGCYMMIVTDEMLEKEEKKYNEYLAKHAPKKNTTKKSAENAKKAPDNKQKFKATQKK